MYDIAGIYQAQSVFDAVCALRDDPEAVLICGGTDVLIQVRAGKLAGRRLVSIHGLPALSGVFSEPDGTLRIGPATTFFDLSAHPVIRERVPMLGQAADQVGSPQIRRMGTIGGNIANAATSADTAPSLFAYQAVLELTGPDGVRQVPIADFYTGPGKSVRAHDEVLTAIRISHVDFTGFFGCYLKYGKRNAMEISTLGCAALVRLDDAGRVEDLRLAFGVAAPTPIRCGAAEALARGSVPDETLYDALADAVRQNITPRSSWRASADFRLQIAGELTRRAVRDAVRQAKEGAAC